MKHVPKRTKGFTLMEVMVSIAIVGILFLPMLSFFSHAVKINVASKNMQRANAVGQSVIEEVKQYKNLAAMESAGYTLNGDGTYTIHVYDIIENEEEGHTGTTNWLYVDANGKGTDLLGEDIDIHP